MNLNFCWWLDSNVGPPESEATALPTEPQPLPNCGECFTMVYLPRLDRYKKHVTMVIVLWHDWGRHVWALLGKERTNERPTFVILMMLLIIKHSERERRNSYRDKFFGIILSSGGDLKVRLWRQFFHKDIFLLGDLFSGKTVLIKNVNFCQ